MVFKQWVNEDYHGGMNRPVKVDHHDPLVKAIGQSLGDRCRVGQGDRLLVAVSGGADSVALLRALMILAERREWNLSLAIGHVQHHLRDEAEGDAIFVQSLAAQLRLPFLRADLNLLENKGNIEGNARQQRYEALTTMATAVGARHIVTAHHGQDQIETMLMRLLRGSSLKGFSGMAWRRPFIDKASAQQQPMQLIRPMLAIDRQEILRFLKALNQPWCEDQTNGDASRLRARLRRDVLPVLRELKPDVATRAVMLSDQLRQAGRVLDDAIAVVLDRVIVQGSSRTLDRTDARTLRTIVLTGALRRLLLELGARADRLTTRTMKPMIRAIGDTTGGTRLFQFSEGVIVRVTRTAVVVSVEAESRLVRAARCYPAVDG